jgi:antitoxin VapB
LHELPFSDTGNAMKTTQIFHTDGTQAVKLPDGFQFEGDTVSIRREGEAVILEPVKPATWPPGFFDSIRIDDPAFGRPEQGPVPPAPSLD